MFTVAVKYAHKEQEKENLAEEFLKIFKFWTRLKTDILKSKIADGL